MESWQGVVVVQDDTGETDREEVDLRYCDMLRM